MKNLIISIVLILGFAVNGWAQNNSRSSCRDSRLRISSFLYLNIKTGNSIKVTDLDRNEVEIFQGALFLYHPSKDSVILLSNRFDNFDESISSDYYNNEFNANIFKNPKFELLEVSQNNIARLHIGEEQFQDYRFNFIENNSYLSGKICESNSITEHGVDLVNIYDQSDVKNLVINRFNFEVSKLEIRSNNQIIVDENAAIEVDDTRPPARSTNLNQNPALQYEQNELLQSESRTVMIQGVPVVRSQPGTYVCIGQGTLNTYTDEPFGARGNSLSQGQRVLKVQGSDAQRRVEQNGQSYNFIKISVDNTNMWVAADYIKNYADCPEIHLESIAVCTSGGTVNIRGEDIIDDEVGSLDLAQEVFRFSGHQYSSITAEVNGSDVKFVPIKLAKDAEEVFWIGEGFVNYDSCEAFQNTEVTKACYGKVIGKNRHGNPHSYSTGTFNYDINYSESFPIKERPTQTYLDGTGSFGWNRRSGRRYHAGVDLYNQTRGRQTVNNHAGRARNRPYGERVYAMAAGEVIEADAFYCQTDVVAVKDKFGKIWRYGEIGYLKVNVGDRVEQGEWLGTSVQVGSCADSYPPMLHIERFDGSASGDLTRVSEWQRGINKFAKRKDLVNPTCLIQELEKQEFGVRY